MTNQSYSPSWPAPTANLPISGTISLPGSKSLMNRELVLSALASHPSELIDPLDSRDSNLMIQALTQLGTKIRSTKNSLQIEPQALVGPAAIDCGLAGTVMRFVPPLAALVNGKVSFDGDAAARKRPMQTTTSSLRALGAEVHGDSLPFEVHGSGKVVGGELTIDASKSSQFVSGLLLAAPRFQNGLTLTHVGDQLPSLPHIEMTIECLRNRGVQASKISDVSWRVEPGEISGGTFKIEPDLSNAGPFLAAALVAGGNITISHWPSVTSQVGDQFDGILQRMGATISRTQDTLTVSSNGEIHGIEIDLSQAGELTPVVAALAALADSATVISGVAHLRGHETDRLNALVSEINSLGGRARETADGIVVEPAKLSGGIWKTYGDHRMATAGAIIGLRVPGVEIEDITVTSKTMPEFVPLWNLMLGVA